MNKLYFNSIQKNFELCLMSSPRETGLMPATNKTLTDAPRILEEWENGFGRMVLTFSGMIQIGAHLDPVIYSDIFIYIYIYILDSRGKGAL